MIDAYITNLGKYNEGQLVGEWVSFPTDSEKLQEVFENIGIGKEYEEFFITDYEINDSPDLANHLGKHESLEELNYLALTLEKLDTDELEKYNACLESGMEQINSIADAINVAQNMDCYALYSDIEDKYDLGYYYVHEVGGYDLGNIGNLSNYIDYEAFGRDIAYEQIGAFTYVGYVEQIDRVETYYSSVEDIPLEAELFCDTTTKSVDYLKNTELDTEENYNNIDGVRNNVKPQKEEKQEKPSLLGELKETKEAVKEATAKNEKESSPHSKEEDCR